MFKMDDSPKHPVPPTDKNHNFGPSLYYKFMIVSSYK